MPCPVSWSDYNASICDCRSRMQSEGGSCPSLHRGQGRVRAYRVKIDLNGCFEHSAERMYTCGQNVNMLFRTCVICTDDVVIVIDMVSKDICRPHVLVRIYIIMMFLALGICACTSGDNNVVIHLITHSNCRHRV